MSKGSADCLETRHPGGLLGSKSSQPPSTTSLDLNFTPRLVPQPVSPQFSPVAQWMKRNMFAALYLCLNLLLAASPSHARPSWTKGILDSKDGELSLRKPLEVPNQLLESQDAVKALIQGVNEEAQEHLAAMKHKHMQLARQQFFNALEKRLFRLDVLKPQPTWQLRPCRGSAFNCFLLPRKPLLGRPVHAKPRPVTYINDPNFCNHLPFNTYLFHECKRRAQLLYPQVTTTPKTEAHSAAIPAHVTDTGYTTSEHISKKVQQITLPKNFYNLDTTPSIDFEKTQKLNSQKNTVQLENEILGIKDNVNDRIFINNHSTEKNTFTTRKITDAVTQDELANARNELEPSTLSVDQYKPTTNSATVHHILTTLSSDLEITAEGRTDQLLPVSTTSSSFINEAKEFIQTSTGDSKTTSYVSPTSYLTLTSSMSNEKIQEANIQTESSGNVKELENEAKEEVNISLPESTTQYVFPNPETDQKESNVDTEESQTETAQLAREEIRDFNPLPDEFNTRPVTSDFTPMYTTQVSSIISSTSLSKWSKEGESPQTITTTDTSKSNENGNSALIKPTGTTFYTTEEKSPVKSRTEQSEVTYREEATEEMVPSVLESTSTSKPEIAAITLKTDEIESPKDNIEEREYAQHLLEDVKVQSTSLKEIDQLDIVQTTPFNSREDDTLPTNSIVEKEPYLDVQDKLLDRPLYSGQSDNVNYEENHSYTASVDSKEKVVEPSTEFEDKTNPRLTFEETTTDSTMNVDDKESKTIDEMIVTTEYSELGNNDFTERSLDIDLPTENASSKSSVTSFTTNNKQTSDDVLKFTSEISTKSFEKAIIEEKLSSTPLENIVSENDFTLGTNNNVSLREKRSPEDKLPGKIEDSASLSGNSTDVYISPTKYASTILELVPVVREGYKNNAFSDEDKKVIQSIFGEMRTFLDKDSLKEIEESATDLLMGDETSRVEDMGEYYDYDSSESVEAAEEKSERRLKRSKNIQTLTTLVTNLPKHLQGQFKNLPFSSSLRSSRKTRSSGPQPVSEAAAILALLAEDGEGVQLDRADDEDDDEYEYYEDDDGDEDGDEDSYEDSYEEDDNPSFFELIKLARKHRQRKAMK